MGRKSIQLNFLAVLAAVLVFAGFFLTACSPSSGPASTTLSQPVTLRLALIPVLDALPIYVAQQEGLFEAHGVKVELIPVRSAPERDQLITSGQADGMINEVVLTLFFNKTETQIQIVRFARAASADSPVFRILASKNSGITAVEGLKGIEIGVSKGTVIEYLTDRLLQAEGFSPEEIQTIAVPSIVDRTTLLINGELQAAMLPDPFASQASAQGAVVVIEDSRRPAFSHSTLSFRKAVIDEHPEAIRSFLAAIEEAVAKINAEPARWNSVLSEQKVVPQELAGKFTVPPFVPAGVPSEAQWNDALAWAKEKGLLDQDVSYKDSVNPNFLP
jgi:NitT/TauT family transport system substrate-binding protein